MGSFLGHIWGRGWARGGGQGRRGLDASSLPFSWTVSREHSARIRNVSRNTFVEVKRRKPGSGSGLRPGEMITLSVSCPVVKRSSWTRKQCARLWKTGLLRWLPLLQRLMGF